MGALCKIWCLSLSVCSCWCGSSARWSRRRSRVLHLRAEHHKRIASDSRPTTGLWNARPTRTSIALWPRSIGCVIAAKALLPDGRLSSLELHSHALRLLRWMFDPRRDLAGKRNDGHARFFVQRRLRQSPPNPFHSYGRLLRRRRLLLVRPPYRIDRIAQPRRR
mgnify:CR=1 FL=1